MAAVALLTLALAAAPPLAVVDLSAPPAPALAEALRALPELKGRSLSASQTALIVADAAGLGLSCSYGDDGCLQKLVVLARVEELWVLDANADEVRLARVTARAVERADARVAGSPTVRAHAAWSALRRLLEGRREGRGIEPSRHDEGADPGGGDEALDEGGTSTGARDATRAPAAQAPPAETPTASSGGVTTPLVVGMGGLGAALVAGAGAIGVSAALAQQLRGTERGVPLDDSYDGLQLAFWSLSALSAASALTGVVGLAFFFAEEPAALSAP